MCEWWRVTSGQEMSFSFLLSTHSYGFSYGSEWWMTFFVFSFPPLKIQIVLWQPVTADLITKQKEVHFFVNVSDVNLVKAHLHDSTIQFR